MVVLCSASGAARADKLLFFLRRAAIDAVAFPVPDGSPSLVNIDRAVLFVRRMGASAMAGFGGGGILDMTKVGAACMSHLRA